jgi:hypothetical protein
MLNILGRGEKEACLHQTPGKVFPEIERTKISSE